MCGFVGFVSKNNNVSSINIEKMMEHISHRGPDDRRLWVDKKRGIYLGFCRLSMVDLLDSSQPYIDNDTPYIVLFNGEIYNYKHLKSTLIDLGYSFSSNGEVEVLLKMYIEYGDSFIKKLDGMFSICIINRETKDIIFARDRFGIKPLYFFEDNDGIVFASELKAIRSIHKFELDYRSLELFLNFRFIPAPYTIFQNVYKLKAGEYVKFSSGKKTVIQQHLYNQSYPNVQFANSVFRNKLYNSIFSTFMSSDVPIGLFLSGGIDSGVIASYLKEELRSNNRVFSIDYLYNSSRSDEALVVRKLSDELMIRPQNIILGEKILNLLDSVVYSLDEPFYSTVSISTYCLAQNASSFVKGVLTGDGSDESIYGYRYIRNALSAKNVYEEYLSGIGWLKYIQPHSLFGGSVLTKDDLLHILFADCEVSNSQQETLRRVELFKRVPDYHMMRVDKLTMSFGLEARIPYLRNDYVDYLLSIPYSEICQSADSKEIIKKGMQHLLPSALTDVIKKPFSAPIKSWIEKELSVDIRRIFSNKELIERLQLNNYVVNDLLVNYKGNYADISNIWGIYLLLKWCERDTFAN